MASKIVARLKDGTVIKGTIADFYTNKDSFHIRESKSGKGHVVEMNKVKAVFFVKTLKGDKSRKRKKGFIQESEFGKRTVVKFDDGEVLYGYSEDYYPTSKGFFLYLTDPGSNNTKVFIPNHAVYDIRLGKDIENSPYANLAPKFIQKIVPKFITVSLKVTVGQFNLRGAKIKVLTDNKVYTTEDEGVTVKLKPGKHTLEIIYDNYKVKKEIDVSKDSNNFTIDLQLEAH